MKKKLLIVISLILAVMSILGACVKNPDTAETTGEDTVGETGEVFEPMFINGVNATEYTLVYDSTAVTGSSYARN